MTRESPAGQEASQARPARRGVYANGVQKREEIIERALSIFAGQGFRRLSLRKIAEELGTSHAALSYHFPTQASLLEAVLERQSEREQDLIATGLEERGLLDFGPDYVREAHSRPAIVQLDVTLQAEAIRADHEAHEWAHERIRSMHELMTLELAKERDKGRLRDDVDIEVMARLVTAVMRGLEIQWLYDPSISVAEDLEALTDLIRARPGELSD